MKHTIKITLMLITLFLVSQVIGLFIVSKQIDFRNNFENKNITYSDLPYDIEVPEVDESNSYITIAIAILISTGLMLLLIRYKVILIFKLWFLLAVVVSLSLAFGSLINESVAITLAIILGAWKIYKPNFYIHNLTEIFIYGGIISLLFRIMNIQSIFILLFIVSLYDMYAVWKSKHMVKMATFQIESKVFAGLSIPYNAKSKKISIEDIGTSKKIKSKKGIVKNAILGGGDIAFPLLFAAVALKVFSVDFVMWLSLVKVGIIVLFSTIALSSIFYFSEKNKFYPAMPFLSIGCAVGYIIAILI